MILGVLLLSLTLVGMALAADNTSPKENQPQSFDAERLFQIGGAVNTPTPEDNGSRSGIPDTTLPVANVLSPDSFSQGFEDITNLPNWFMQNNSDPLGLTNWSQGVDGVFPAYDGTPTAYISANYNNTGAGGTISNWLLTPELVLGDHATFSFWTRVPTGSTYPDRLQVRLSLAGPSVSVGTGAEGVGDFTTLLLEINPNQDVGGYPEEWTQFEINLTGIPGGSSGRIALRYYVTNAGPTAPNSDYIGIDRVIYTDPPPLISVDPLSLHATQPPNRITTQQLLICNTGGGDLSWSMTEVPANQVGVILLIDTTDTTYSVQRALNALGYPFNRFMGTDWTSIDFTPYNVVIVSMDGGIINQPSIQKLRTEVIDAGKRLIFVGGTQWENFVMGVNQYLVLNDTANYGWKISAPPHFTIVDPASPLAQGLPSPYSFVNSSAGYYMIRVNDPNIHAVGINGDGYNSLFYKGANFPLIEGDAPQAVGDFVWFTSSSYTGYWTNPSDFTFLKQVLSNAIQSNLILGTNWLGGSDVSSLVPSGETSTSVLGGSLPLVPVTVEPSQAVPEGMTPSSTPDRLGTPTNSANPEAVLWDQPLSTVNQNAYVDQVFPDWPTYSSYLADDFSNTAPWMIQTIFIPGDGWSGFSTLFNATELTWQIYADAGGVPAGDPSGGGAPALWTLTLPPTDTQVIITNGTPGGLPSNTQLNLTNPVNLLPGHYWLIFYPTMEFADGQYGRQPSDTTNGYTGQFINPGEGFGFGPNWQDWNILGPAQTDIAFRLEGVIFNIPWLSENPINGTLGWGQCQMIPVTFNSTGLALGDYFGALRISSNDLYNPVVNVGVTLTVANYHFYLPIAIKH